MISSKCLQVISRQSNFERLERCLNKIQKKKQQKRTSKQLSSLWDASEGVERNVLKKLARNCLQVSRKRRREEQRWWRRKCLKLNNGYLLLEACYEASLPIFFSVYWIRQIDKVPLCLEQVFSVIDPEASRCLRLMCQNTFYHHLWLITEQTYGKKEPSGKL